LTKAGDWKILEATAYGRQSAAPVQSLISDGNSGSHGTKLTSQKP
jgi:hypothetical protein